MSNGRRCRRVVLEVHPCLNPEDSAAMMFQLEAAKHKSGMGTSHKTICRWMRYESAQMSLAATTNLVAHSSKMSTRIRDHAESGILHREILIAAVLPFWPIRNWRLATEAPVVAQCTSQGTT